MKTKSICETAAEVLDLFKHELLPDEAYIIFDGKTVGISHWDQHDYEAGDALTPSQVIQEMAKRLKLPPVCIT